MLSSLSFKILDKEVGKTCSASYTHRKVIQLGDAVCTNVIHGSASDLEAGWATHCMVTSLSPQSYDLVVL